MQKILILEHLAKDILQLLFPGHLVLFQHLVDAVFKEDALQGAVMPVVLQFSKLNLKLCLQDVTGMIGVILQDLIYRKEHRLVFTDNACVGGDFGLALSECVQRVNGLVRRNIGRKMDDNLHFVRGHIVYLLDVYLLLLLGLDDAVNNRL